MTPLKTALVYSGMSLVSLVFFSGTAFPRDLYWSEQKKIFASDIDGGNVTEIFDGGLSNPPMESFIVDIDATNDHIYWTGHGGGDVWRANRDGSDPVQLISGTGASVHFLEIDEAAGTLRFTDFGGRILQTDLAGENLQTVLNDNRLAGLAGFTAHPNPGSYDAVLAVRSGSPHLFHLVLDEWGGWLDSQVQLEGGNGNYGMVYVPATNTIYYTNYNENRLRSYNLDTKEHELMVTPGLAGPLDIELSPSGTHLLIAERGRGVSAFQLDNYGYELLADAPRAHFGVAVTADPAALPPGSPPEDFFVLFQADFEDDPVGELPLKESAGGVWSSIAENENANGINRSHGMTVETDELNIFGYGVENKYLHIEDNSGAFIYGNLITTTGVATLSYEFYAMRTTITPPSGSERMGFAFFDSSANRLHLHSVTGEGLIRGTYGGPGQLPVYKRGRIDIILNNTEAPVTYEDPSGSEVVLGSVASHVWLDGELIADFSTAYSRGENATTGNNISQIRIPTHSSTDRLSILLDNITVFKGARVLEQLVEGVDPTDPVDPPPPFGGFVEADWEGVPLGEINRENWEDFVHGNLSSIAFNSTYDNEGNPLLMVAQDTENHFGEGPENQVLRTNGARNWLVYANNNFNEEVMTARIDMIAERVGSGRLTLQFSDPTATSVAQLDLRATAAEAGTFNQHGSWEYGVVNRFEMITNNSAETITYDTPGGGTRSLVSGGTDVWLNGEPVVPTEGITVPLVSRNASAQLGPIMNFRLNTFSTNPWIGDINWIQTLPGAQLVGAAPPSFPEGYADWLDSHFPGENDPSIIGPDADPDGDGVPNLIEYALGMDPNDASREGLPLLGEVLIDGERYLTLTGTLPDGTNLDLAVEATSDLGGWSEPDLGVPVGATPNGDGTTTYIFRDVEPMDSNSHRFMRLYVDFRAD